MPNEIVALAQQYAQRQAQAAIRRVTVPAACGLIAAVFFVVVMVALFAALFFWLETLFAPPVAALIVAGVALVLGLLALTPLMVKRRPPPQPALTPTAPQFVSLLGQTASSLARQRPLLMAILLAAALGFMARGSSGEEKK
jgi:preprotein translocase subunit SecE